MGSSITNEDIAQNVNENKTNLRSIPREEKVSSERDMPVNIDVKKSLHRVSYAEGTETDRIMGLKRSEQETSMLKKTTKEKQAKVNHVSETRTEIVKREYVFREEKKYPRKEPERNLEQIADSEKNVNADFEQRDVFDQREILTDNSRAIAPDDDRNDYNEMKEKDQNIIGYKKNNRISRNENT